MEPLGPPSRSPSDPESESSISSSVVVSSEVNEAIESLGVLVSMAVPLVAVSRFQEAAIRDASVPPNVSCRCNGDGPGDEARMVSVSSWSFSYSNRQYMPFSAYQDLRGLGSSVIKVCFEVEGRTGCPRPGAGEGPRMRGLGPLAVFGLKSSPGPEFAKLARELPDPNAGSRKTV